VSMNKGFNFQLYIPSSSSSSSSLLEMELPLASLSSCVLLHHSSKMIDLMVAFPAMEGGMEEGEEGGMEERFSRMGSPLFMEEEEEDEVEWSDACAPPPSFLETCASSLRSILGSAALMWGKTVGWVKEGGKAGGRVGGRAVRAACQAVVEGAKNFVSYISS